MGRLDKKNVLEWEKNDDRLNLAWSRKLDPDCCGRKDAGLMDKGLQKVDMERVKEGKMTVMLGMETKPERTVKVTVDRARTMEDTYLLEMMKECNRRQKVDNGSVMTDSCCLLRRGCLDDKLMASNLCRSVEYLKHIPDLMGLTDPRDLLDNCFLRHHHRRC